MLCRSLSAKCKNVPVMADGMLFEDKLLLWMSQVAACTDQQIPFPPGACASCAMGRATYALTACTTVGTDLFYCSRSDAEKCMHVGRELLKECADKKLTPSPDYCRFCRDWGRVVHGDKMAESIQLLLDTLQNHLIFMERLEGVTGTTSSALALLLLLKNMKENLIPGLNVEMQIVRWQPPRRPLENSLQNPWEQNVSLSSCALDAMEHVVAFTEIELKVRKSCLAAQERLLFPAIYPFMLNEAEPLSSRKGRSILLHSIGVLQQLLACTTQRIAMRRVCPAPGDDMRALAVDIGSQQQSFKARLETLLEHVQASNPSANASEIGSEVDWVKIPASSAASGSMISVHTASPCCFLFDSVFQAENGDLRRGQDLWKGSRILAADGRSMLTVIAAPEIHRVHATVVLQTDTASLQVTFDHRICLASGEAVTGLN